MAVSTRGLRLLAQRFDAVGARTTLFTTANYALHEPELIRQLAEKHEIASHGYFHTTFEPADLLKSRLALEALLKRPVTVFVGHEWVMLIRMMCTRLVISTIRRYTLPGFRDDTITGASPGIRFRR
ncbi:hypothetical protein [Spirosoma telluris]|uniref:hypothetical protein n=1 Tax=Spirosoma telluris TaxID=2183553 RepID=UPI002FC35832